MIKDLPRVIGPWMLDVKKAGLYRITLRQYSKDAGCIVEDEKAKITIAGQELEKPVETGSKGGVFEIELPK